MTIKEQVLIICYQLGIKRNSRNIVDYEVGKKALDRDILINDYQQAIKILADVIGV